ncbi:MAG: hypothetical protein K2G56_02950 [Eubacterium sp.]|nr:hypothetical protein [Eubacterium sp.]
MDKNEILEKSRKENSKQDEYAKDVNKKCSMIGMIASAVVCFALTTIEPLFGREINDGYGVILTTINLSMWLYKGIKLKDKHYIITAMIWLLATILTVVNYVMDLIG